MARGWGEGVIVYEFFWSHAEIEGTWVGVVVSVVSWGVDVDT